MVHGLLVSQTKSGNLYISILKNGKYRVQIPHKGKRITRIVANLQMALIVRDRILNQIGCFSMKKYDLSNLEYNKG
jgi:hypothetical protein